MSDPGDEAFRDFGPLPARAGVQVVSVDPVPGGVRVVLLIATPGDRTDAA